MRAELTAEIRVHRVAVFAEMAWMERRPELGLLCRAGREHGRITTAVVQSAVPGLSDAGANNVIAWCKMLGLCDAHGGLSELGNDVAETDQAPVPEQGVYGLWLAEHPVIGGRVLAAVRLASTRDQRFESIRPMPVAPDRRRLFSSVLDGKDRFMVRDLPTNNGQPGAMVVETRATCRLRWTLDFAESRDQWQLEGKVEAPLGNGKEELRAMQHEPESDGLDLWKLAASWAMGPFAPFGRWQANERRLAVEFDPLTEHERETFRKTLSLGRVPIPGKGEYENVTLRDVPIGPNSPKDAQRWAMARLERRLSKDPPYRSRSQVRELFAQVTEGTSLEPFAPTLPSHDDLLAQSAGDPGRFWTLAAPVDLAPFPVAPDELGEFNIGQEADPVSAMSSGAADVVRIPYGGG